MLHKNRKENSLHPGTRHRLIALAVASACATFVAQAQAQEANNGAANAADPATTDIDVFSPQSRVIANVAL